MHYTHPNATLFLRQNQHHERKKDRYLSNPDIGTSRSYENYHIIEPHRAYKEEIKARVEDAGCKVRKDSVLMIDTLITASAEFFEHRSEKEQRKYFELASVDATVQFTSSTA